jgi:ATP-binding cassette, subfamily B, heavy metal transporter
MAEIEVSDKEVIDFRYNFKVYFGFLKKYRWGCVFLVGLVFLISGLDQAVILAFKRIVDDTTLYVQGKMGLEALQGRLLPILAFFLALPLVRSWNRWQYLGSINRLESKLIADIKRHFFNHLLLLSHGFHSSHKTGSLISRLIRGSGAVETMTDVFIFQFVPVFFQLALSSGLIFYYSLPVGLDVWACIILYLAFSIQVTRRQQRANALYNNISDIEKANISDVFTNIESIKFFAKEGEINRRFFEISEKTRELQLGFWDQYKWLEGGQLLILGLGTFGLMWLSVRDLSAGRMSTGTFVLMITNFAALSQTLSGFVMGIRNLYRAGADFEDLFQYDKVQNEIKDRPGAKPLKVGKGAIEFRDVAFTYRRKPVLSGFTLKVPSHARVALVGPSGAGKTTLVRLLYRLYDVERGSILIDGKDIAQAAQVSLRDSMSMVPQECILFDDTIYNNIAFSNPEAGRREVFAAIRISQLEKFVQGLPQREKTVVGERGVKLSGGEKQRVSIARALLADKRILILDEATSSLDSETEHEIQKGLAGLMKGRTCILIAHRLSTIMSSDLIVVLDKGRVIQQGKHRDLIRRKGLYRKLWNLQKGGYIG